MLFLQAVKSSLAWTALSANHVSCSEGRKVIRLICHVQIIPCHVTSHVKVDVHSSSPPLFFWQSGSPRHSMSPSLARICMLCSTTLLLPSASTHTTCTTSYDRRDILNSSAANRLVWFILDFACLKNIPSRIANMPVSQWKADCASKPVIRFWLN